LGDLEKTVPFPTHLPAKVVGLRLSALATLIVLEKVMAATKTATIGKNLGEEQTVEPIVSLGIMTIKRSERNNNNKSNGTSFVISDVFTEKIARNGLTTDGR
jgi:hypothetical protein